MDKEPGFILRQSHLHEHTFFVLTRRYGKICVVIKPYKYIQTFSPGTLLLAVLERKSKKTWICHSTETICPLVLAQQKLFIWAHHILELSYYFLPLEDPAVDVFNFLYHIMITLSQEPLIMEHFNLIRRIISLRFFVLIGFYPDKELLPLLDLFHPIIRLCVDLSPDEKVKFLHNISKGVSMVQLRMIDSWLTACLQHHPYQQAFKTTRFLDL